MHLNKLLNSIVPFLFSHTSYTVPSIRSTAIFKRVEKQVVSSKKAGKDTQNRVQFFESDAKRNWF